MSDPMEESRDESDELSEANQVTGGRGIALAHGESENLAPAKGEVVPFVEWGEMEPPLG